MLISERFHDPFTQKEVFPDLTPRSYFDFCDYVYPIVKEMEYGSTEIGDSPDVVGLFLNYYRNSDIATKIRLDKTMEKMEIFEGRERGIVFLALCLATVGHQYNLNEAKRYRKADSSPYIYHSLEMAEKPLDEGVVDY